MSTLDDKLLGEKLHYYCSSSSESEGEDDDEEKSPCPDASAGPALNNGSCQQWDGTSCNVMLTFSLHYLCNVMKRKFIWVTLIFPHFLSLLQTGPKGVIKDYQRFKQLERERREEQKEELAILAKKFSITCRTNVSLHSFRERVR